MTEPLLSLESSEMTKPSEGGVTDHGALTGLGDNDHPQYFNPLSNNGIIKYNNQNNPDFRYDYNSSTSGATWQRIAIVTISTGTYAGANFEVELIHAGGNWGQTTPTSMTFSVRTTRSGAVQDDYNNAAIIGPSTDYCRVVKTTTGVYEIQIRTISDYTWMTVQVRPIAASTSRATVSYGFATGSSTGTIYSSVIPSSNGIDHGALTGLADNDHPQYSLTSHVHDHGSLTGLGDDDHSQYLNTARHDMTVRHALGTIVPHDAHNSLTGLTTGDPHTQYVKDPGTVTDNALVRFDTTDGRTIQNSGVTVSDTNDLVSPGGGYFGGAPYVNTFSLRAYGRGTTSGTGSLICEDSAGSNTLVAYDSGLIAIDKGGLRIGGTDTPTAGNLVVNGLIRNGGYDIKRYAHTPTMVGWESYSISFNYWIVNELLLWSLYMSAGVSNATNATISLPVTVAQGGNNWGLCGWGMDNSLTLTAPAQWTVPNGATVITFYKTVTQGAWTATGNKRVIAQGFYGI